MNIFYGVVDIESIYILDSRAGRRGHNPIQTNQEPGNTASLNEKYFNVSNTFYM